jgi:hypothetical protein
VGRRVDVVYDADTTARRVELTVHLPDGASGDQTERLRRVADTCPVRRAFEAGFAFDERPHDLAAVPTLHQRVRARQPGLTATPTVNHASGLGPLA